MDKVEEFVKHVGKDRTLGDLNDTETKELANLLIESGNLSAIIMGAMMLSDAWKEPQNSPPKE